MSNGNPTIRVGVIGCGVIAYWVHLRQLKTLPGAKLVAASDPDPEARARARKLISAPVIENEAGILGDSSIDAVVICAPSNLHADIAVKACDAGKHVFVEKPVATTARDCERVLAAAKKAGVTAAIGFNRRSHPMFEQARAMIIAGEIGPIRAIQTAFCEPMSPADMGAWRQTRSTGGGVLLDLASHHIDLVRWFCRDEIESVEATIASELTEQDSAGVTLRLESGTQIQSFFSFRSARADYLDIIGEKGTLRVDKHDSVLSLRASRRFGYGTSSRRVIPTPSVAAWRLKRIARPSTDPSYRRALSAFIGSINGLPANGATFDDGARALDVVLAAEESARTHQPVRVVPA